MYIYLESQIMEKEKQRENSIKLGLMKCMYHPPPLVSVLKKEAIMVDRTWDLLFPCGIFHVIVVKKSSNSRPTQREEFSRGFYKLQNDNKLTQINSFS